MESINWQEVMGVVATVGVLGVLTAIWLAVRHLMRANIESKEWQIARAYVQDLVYAVEKTMRSAEGKEKLNAVVNKALARFPWLQPELVRMWVEAVLQEWDNQETLAAANARPAAPPGSVSPVRRTGHTGAHRRTPPV